MEVITIRLRKDDKDIKEYLSQVDPKLVAPFVRDVLRFYMKMNPHPVVRKQKYEVLVVDDAKQGT